MEFVIVVFPDDRAVLIDGVATGHTNRSLQVDTGTHTFSLGSPQDYTPTQRQLLVQNTTIIRPLRVIFEKI
jgi:hypothetical protein